LVSNLWTVPFADPSKARQITFGQTPIIAGVEMPHGKILAVSGDDEPWIMNIDGTGAAPFSNLHDVAPAVMCGPFVILTSYDPTANIPRGGAAALKATKLASGRLVVQRSYQSGPADIMRLDADGLNAKKLASGLLYSPTCSPDGKYIFYVLMGHPQKIMRTPIEGGVPLEIGDIPDTIRGAMRISPDGRFLSFPNDEIISNKPVTKLVIVPANGGPPIKRFDAPSGIYREGCLRWSPNGQGLQYLLTKGDVTNLWEQPVVGGEPSQITHFTSGRMFDFNWSPDGKTLLLSRGEISSDVVLLSSSR
jgi:hypothetical protein